MLTRSTNPPKVATSTDIPPTDHGNRRQTSDTPPENYREQEGCYATRPGSAVSPAEYLLQALAGCYTVTLTALAAAMLFFSSLT